MSEKEVQDEGESDEPLRRRHQRGLPKRPKKANGNIEHDAEPIDYTEEIQEEIDEEEVEGTQIVTRRTRTRRTSTTREATNGHIIEVDIGERNGLRRSTRIPKPITTRDEDGDDDATTSSSESQEKGQGKENLRKIIRCRKTLIQLSLLGVERRWALRPRRTVAPVDKLNYESTQTTKSSRRCSEEIRNLDQVFKILSTFSQWLNSLSPIPVLDRRRVQRRCRQCSTTQKIQHERKPETGHKLC
jgi:hypothetical protein